MNAIIRKKREELKLSQSALGKLVGVSQQHIDRYEKGYPIPLDKVLALSNILNIEKWELLPEEFKPLTSKKAIYKIGYVQAGKFNEACQLPESEWESIPFAANDDYKTARLFALGVRGDSMNLTFPPDRTTLICCPLEDWLIVNPELPLEGKYIIAYCRRPDGTCEATVKKYTRIDDNTVILVAESSNPEIKPIILQPDSNQYEIAAVVIGDMRTY